MSLETVVVITYGHPPPPLPSYEVDFGKVHDVHLVRLLLEGVVLPPREHLAPHPLGVARQHMRGGAQHVQYHV